MTRRCVSEVTEALNVETH